MLTGVANSHGASLRVKILTRSLWTNVEFDSTIVFKRKRPRFIEMTAYWSGRLLQELISGTGTSVAFVPDRHNLSAAMNATRCICLALLALAVPCLALDQNGNQQSDVWEMIFGASGLPGAGDADHDGWSNALESAAGTNPLDGASFPGLHLATDVASLQSTSSETSSSSV